MLEVNKLKGKLLTLLLIVSLLFPCSIAFAKPQQPFTFHTKPSTELQPNPWHIEVINAEVAWSVSTADSINVAVLDSGVDTDHPDLKENIVGGINFVPLNFFTSIVKPDKYEDTIGHGTFVTGVLGALNNNYGTVGVTPNVNVYAVRVGSSYPILDYIVQGIYWCIDNNINVISMSFGSPYNYPELEEACQIAYDNGIILVASTGNRYEIEYPAKYSSVIAVGGVDQNNNVPEWSGQGLELELVAPAIDIFSTDYRGKYIVDSGTSASAPQVAGWAALIMSMHTEWSNTEVRLYMNANAVDLGSEGWDFVTGYGLVDCSKI